MRYALAVAVAALVCAVPALAGGYKPPRDVPVKADQQRAAAIVLRARDLPAGWRGSKSGAVELSGAGCPGVNLDASGITRTGAAVSPDFERGAQVIVSTVDVLKTAPDARAWIGDGFSPVVLRCITRLVATGLERELEKNGITAVVRMQPTQSLKTPKLVEQSTSARLGFTVATGGLTVNMPVSMVFDVILLRQGRIATALLLMSAEGAPPAALEQQLARLLASRMKR